MASLKIVKRPICQWIMLKKAHKIIFLLLGHIAMLLGVIGAVLPIVPTTPFLLLAAYFYSKGSPKLHAKLRNLPHFGVHLKSWEDDGVISKKAKLAATLTIVITFSATFYFKKLPLPLIIIMCLSGLGIILFLLTRPSQKKKLTTHQ